MIPYFEQPALALGIVTIHAFGAIVAIAVWVGLNMLQRRFDHMGLDSAVGHQLVRWLLAGGLIGAHLFAVLLYSPSTLRDHPWILLRVWEPISSIGGMLGGLTGALLFYATRPHLSGKPSLLGYLDAVAFVFPVALAIGRFGCALAHDHPGGVTSGPLSISLSTEAAQSYIRGVYATATLPMPHIAPAMGFHDLGLYELLYLSLVIVPAFLYWNRQRRPHGFYLASFAALYFPVRFGLDMLRIADARYFGLTPAQWAAALILVVLPIALLRGRRRSKLVCGTLVLVAACACWGGTT